MNRLSRLKSFINNSIFKRLALRRYYLNKDEFPIRSYIFTKKDIKKVQDIILSGNLHQSSGSNVTSLEKEFAQYNSCTYALAVNSGTSALELALKAINLQPGDEVIVPAYTWVATAQAVLARGGIPRFADIDETFTISPQSIETLITKKTKAIIPVHIYGNVANIEKIISVAQKHHLKIIEDCAQAVGATYKGKKVGTWGEIGCFSFNEKKAIPTGEGGIVTTSNKKLFEIMLYTRDTGMVHKTAGSDVLTIGNNYALTEMQASLARSALIKLDDLNQIRRQNYRNFTEQMLQHNDLPIQLYKILPSVIPSFSRLVFMIDFSRISTSRGKFIEEMNGLGIPLKTFYPVPLYKYSLFQKKNDVLTGSEYPFNANSRLDYKKNYLPFVEKFYKQQVGMEFSPYLTKSHIDKLCKSLINTLTKYATSQPHSD